ncbi:MAG: FMN-binding glutamate synthase family protein [Gammaproteobacteria bacterium]|nr:FMN-binding glutamate synthase family protein [Gammaproteobacteria bacterium]
MGESLPKFLLVSLEVVTAILLLAIILGVIAVAVMYVIDVTQTRHAVRRNYPVIGRFRYMFEHLGEFFRQYFFAMDREEMPFNRTQRSWCYRAAKNVDTTAAFGSTKDLRSPGTVMFANTPFPTLDGDAAECQPMTVGAQCRTPFNARSFFNISAMSYGAISRPAVLALSNGARMAGCWLNTGEGGLSPYHLEGGADIVFQIGTAKNGVRDLDGTLSETKLREIAAHEQVRMFELKLSQGAKPGKGGILPGEKVTAEIAAIRGIRIGEDAISPNRHPEIADNGALIDMINTIRDITGKPTGMKFVMGDHYWLDELFETIVKRGVASAPDFITLDGADGGTGAAPLPLIDEMGLPLRESLPLLIDKLRAYGLRDRVKVIASGKLVTPADVAWALCMGADFINSARGFMFALGCIQAMQCNKNTCPTGVTTHDPDLQRGLDPTDKAVRVMNYCKNLQHEVGIIAHSCGAQEPRQLRRRHARVVTPSGLSISLADLHPENVIGYGQPIPLVNRQPPALQVAAQVGQPQRQQH